MQQGARAIDSCVESLYTHDGGVRERRRTKEMIRVLKGAISVSKSKTGDVIYRFNKYDKRALKCQLDFYDSNARKAGVYVENQKRDVLRKWSILFESQKSVVDSLKDVDGLLLDAMKVDLEDVDEENQQHRDLNESDVLLNPSNQPIRQGETHVCTDKTGLSSSPRQHQGTKLPPPPSGFLVQTGQPPRSDDVSYLDYSPLSERSRLREFLETQKQIQEHLLTRNALSKLKTTLDREYSFYKLRMTRNLPDDPSELLRTLSQETSVSKRLFRQTSARPERQNKDKLDHQRPVPFLGRRSLTLVPHTEARPEVLKLKRSNTLGTLKL